MTTVRIHLNHQEGTLWWAEGGEFVGGSDELHLLVGKIREWAKGESLEVDIQLIGDPPVVAEDSHQDRKLPITSGNDVAGTTHVHKMLAYA